MDLVPTTPHISKTNTRRSSDVSSQLVQRLLTFHIIWRDRARVLEDYGGEGGGGGEGVIWFISTIQTQFNSIQFNSVYLFMLETYIHANNYKNAKETCKRFMISRFHAGHPPIK